MKLITFPEFNESYQVYTLDTDTDENGVPCDIVIIATYNTLESIAKHASIGCNISEVTDMCGEALFARLDKFTVEADLQSLWLDLSNAIFNLGNWIKLADEVIDGDKEIGGLFPVKGETIKSELYPAFLKVTQLINKIHSNPEEIEELPF